MSAENQKGTTLIGGAATEEVLASSDSILNKGNFGAGQKGLQQFFTPETAAKLATRVLGKTIAVLDPTAGDGSLLKFFDPPYSFGVEIDKDQIKAAEGGYNAIRGDIQHVYTLLKLAVDSWDGIVANPPFGLQWEDPTVNGGRPTNSALTTFLYCTRMLSDDGQLVFIDAKSHFDKSIADHDEAKGIYAVIDCPDLGKRANFGVECVIAFAVHPGNRSAESEGYVRRECPVEMLDMLGDYIIEAREAAIGRYNHVANHSYNARRHVDAFTTIQTEYDRRLEGRTKKNREYDALLVGGTTIQWMPSAYAQLALAQHYDDRHAFDGLNRQSINYLIQNERTWIKMRHYAELGVVTIEPRLVETVEALLDENRKIICPLYPIKPQQRLGFLTDVEFIKCKKDDPARDFVAGEKYRLDTDVVTVKKQESRPVEDQKTGAIEMRDFITHRKMMAITIGRHTVHDGGEEASENIKWLLNHFELPDPGDVATRHPDEIAVWEEKVQTVLDQFAENSLKYEAKHPEVTPYTHRAFQKRDIARLLFKSGGLLSWEQGLGKTMGGLAFAQACVNEGAQNAILIITAKDLLDQWTRECERFLGRKPELIGGQAHAKEIAAKLRRPGTSGLYIAYYEGLSLKGTKVSEREDDFTVYEKEEQKQVKWTGRSDYYYTEETTFVGQDGTEMTRPMPIACKFEFNYDLNKRAAAPRGPGQPVPPEDAKVSYGYIPPRYETITKQITTKQVCPECRADVKNGWNGTLCEHELDDGSICGYAHFKVRLRPVASFLSGAFRHGTIIMDEGTLIQGDTAKRSKALRGMTARHKLLLTGTPIKNYVAQAFWPLWWCLGNKSKRFAYNYEGGRALFEDNFAVIENKLGSKGQIVSRKIKPDVTNLSMLWRLLASSIIRRRKEETGEKIVPRFYYTVETPLGTSQRDQIAKWLKDFHILFAQKYPDSKVVKAGMQERMAPMLGMQAKLDYACTIPCADPDYEWTGVEGVSNFTPSNLRVIELAMALAQQGRKVLVGSNVVATSEFIASRLVEKGVNAAHILDSTGKTVNPGKRAKKVYAFQTDEIQVLCAGVKAIRLGHNLDAANAVILHGLDWDYETMDQFVNRVHRLTSKEPIDVFVVVPQSPTATTITGKKWDILAQKGDAANLALDGRLIEKTETEVDELTIMRELVERGIAASEEDIPEESIEDAWETLPELENFEPAVTLIPPRPEAPDTTPIRLAAAFAWLAAQPPWAKPDNTRDRLAAAFAWMKEQPPLPPQPIVPEEALLEAAANLAEFKDEMAELDAMVLAQNAVELAEQQEEVEAITEEQVAEATKSPDPSPDDMTAALLTQMQEQMAEMKALLDAEQAKREELEAEVKRLSNHEQLDLFGTEVAA